MESITKIFYDIETAGFSGMATGLPPSFNPSRDILAKGFLFPLSLPLLAFEIFFFLFITILNTTLVFFYFRFLSDMIDLNINKY